MQFREQWRLVIGRNDGVGGLIEVKALEEGLVEQAADVVGTTLVHRVWVHQKVEAAAQDISPGGEFGAGVSQSELEAVFLDGDIAKFGADLVAGQGAVGEGINEPVFLRIKIADTPSQTGVEFLGGGVFVAQGVI
ncbi:hypothetical protein BOX37_07805 [Nocardia mangyaensis]|uniref:Uncharacterized protein n=1 Tax=Nocardia mangyaensis TaxID=2213200 RepID=A0A1J0VPF1_9NOCA|nr:hypothetical protein [Nocardia mangyaensis]APE33890.1 hypothetical protein BOX37_07805 [Nocardia mangyaensis]